MKDIEIKIIGIIGDGKMGTDIFYYLNDFDFKLVWICFNKEIKVELLNKFNKKIDRLLKSNIIDQDKYKFKLNNTLISEDINNLADCDIVIEAIFEDLDKKIELFKRLDNILNNHCILSTNSSSIIPSKLFINKNRFDKIIGLHFFYPLKLKNIVEIIYTEHTANNIKEIIINFLKKINFYFLIQNEKNAFILNKIFLDFQTMSYNIYLEGYLSIKEIDVLIKKNIFPIGVFDFFDNVGNDIMLTSIYNYIENYKNKDFYLPLIKKLEELVKEKKLGIKSGSGFYSYNMNNKENNYEIKDKKETNIDIELYKKKIIEILQYIYINSVYKSVENKVCNFEELEYLIKEYMGIEKGPIELSNMIGKSKIHLSLLEYYNKTKIDVFHPSALLK